MTWQTVEAVARAEPGAQADADWAKRVRQALAAVQPEQRTEAITSLAQALAARADAGRLVALLAAAPDPLPRHLALLLTAQLPTPLDKSLIHVLWPLLLDRCVPVEAHLAAAAAILHTTGPDGPATREILRALVSGLSKPRAVERLRQLAERVGPAPAIDDLCARLEAKIHMRCPRCQVRLRRPEMVKHLWQEHRLILDNRRVREPWGLIEEWVIGYAKSRDDRLLARGREVAEQMDPDQGHAHVDRMLLANGVEDTEARARLLAEARRRRASLCPHCYGLVPVPEEVPVRFLNISRGRISSAGYRVEVSEAGLVPWLEIDTPRTVVYRGREPDRYLTRPGWTLFLAGPPVVAAFLLALLLPWWGVPPLRPVLVTLLIALLVAVVVRICRRQVVPPLDRAVDYAWKLLAPRLHGDGFSVEDSSFLASLALASVTHGRRGRRERGLERALKYTEPAVAEGTAPVGHLTALWRLAMEDATAVMGDLVALVVFQVGTCLEGKLPLAFAEQLLGDWESDGWTAGNLARLRVLLCDRAFEAGLEVSDVIEVGRMAPALGQALGSEDQEGLARLRLLWSLRSTCPWDRCGRAKTVFEIACYPEIGGKLLARYPDLLLLELVPETGDKIETSPIFICGRGVVFQEMFVPSPPPTIPVEMHPGSADGAYGVILGEHRFPLPGNPEPLARRLKSWIDYFFNDFRPRVAAVPDWRYPRGIEKLRARQAVQCPECEEAFLADPGNVGVPVAVES